MPNLQGAVNAGRNLRNGETLRFSSFSCASVGMRSIADHCRNQFVGALWPLVVGVREKRKDTFHHCAAIKHSARGVISFNSRWHSLDARSSCTGLSEKFHIRTSVRHIGGVQKLNVPWRYMTRFAEEPFARLFDSPNRGEAAAGTITSGSVGERCGGFRIPFGVPLFTTLNRFRAETLNSMW